MGTSAEQKETRPGKPRNGARQSAFREPKPEAQERLPRCLEAHIAKSLSAYSYRATEATTTTAIGQAAASSMTRRAGRAASALFKRQSPRQAASTAARSGRRERRSIRTGTTIIGIPRR